MSVSYRRQREAKENNHKIEQVEMLKQNKALSDLVGSKAANGYQPHQIFWTSLRAYSVKLNKRLLPPEMSRCNDKM